MKLFRARASWEEALGGGIWGSLLPFTLLLLYLAPTSYVTIGVTLVSLLGFILYRHGRKRTRQQIESGEL